MKRLWFLIIVCVIGLIIYLKQSQKYTLQTNIQSSPTPVLINTPTPANFTASFEIYTLGTKRIFTDTKYHALSSDVYITAENPSVIYVKKEGVRWFDFFETLPMKLEKDCIVTGTMQTFCTNEKHKLKFYINGYEDPSALEKTINSFDNLKVVYE